MSNWGKIGVADRKAILLWRPVCYEANGKGRLHEVDDATADGEWFVAVCTNRTEADKLAAYCTSRSVEAKRVEDEEAETGTEEEAKKESEREEGEREERHGCRRRRLRKRVRRRRETQRQIRRRKRRQRSG